MMLNQMGSWWSSDREVLGRRRQAVMSRQAVICRFRAPNWGGRGIKERESVRELLMPPEWWVRHLRNFSTICVVKLEKGGGAIWEHQLGGGVVWCLVGSTFGGFDQGRGGGGSASSADVANATSAMDNLSPAPKGQENWTLGSKLVLDEI
ncbi:Uncharacterized protein Adt_10592 [Abeliophyllum distichum]|uniref:Uncharacterized protein n=1 Tax=Abeliophyllum distichum TaxID=126358 RepID=A0ABD1UKG1_9LAMI